MSNKNVSASKDVSVPFHPKDPKGERWFHVLHATPSKVLNQQDRTQMQEGEDVAKSTGGTVTINKVVKDANGVITALEGTHNSDSDSKKSKLKLAWVPNTEDSRN